MISQYVEPQYLQNIFTKFVEAKNKKPMLQVLASVMGFSDFETERLARYIK
jgi:hypothetical protein